MRFTLVVDCDNDAFFDAEGEPAPCWELAAILRTVANHLETAEDLAPLDSEPILDSNGTRCGTISTTY